MTARSFSFTLLGATALSLAASSACSAAAPAHPNGPEAAAADVKKLKAASGVTANLWAAEPMVVNPTDMDIDAEGRIWICEGANYRSSFQSWGIQRPGGDRIVVLEDTNQDGVADTALYVRLRARARLLQFCRR